MIASLAAGVAERVAWNVLRPGVGAGGEARNVAVALATGRGFADAYGPGIGPTAHLLPISPGLGGIVYSLLGVDGPLSEAVLASWSIGLAMLVYLMVWRAFAELGTPPLARLGAFAAGCVLPAYIGQEAVDFRLWDGGLTGAVAAFLLLRLFVAARSGASTARDVATIGACGGLLMFLNVPVGVAAAASAAIFALPNLAWRRTALMAGVGAITLAACTTPWAIRNHRVFGEFVPSRSNAGLELAVGMDPASLETKDRLARFNANMAAVHPVYPIARRAMERAGGEIAYSRAQGRRVIAWMSEQPGTALRLMVLHMRQQFAPEPFQFATFGLGALSPVLRSMIVTTISVLGLIAIGAALARRRPAWIYLAIFIALMSLLTAPFQPMPRYTYLFYPFLLFAAADLIARLVRRGREPRRVDDARDPSRPNPSAS